MQKINRILKFSPLLNVLNITFCCQKHSFKIGSYSRKDEQFSCLDRPGNGKKVLISHGLYRTFKRVVFVGIVLIVINSGLLSQAELGQSRLFAIEELRADFRQMQELLDSGQSILYKFTDKSTFEQFVERQFAKIDRPMSLSEFYRIISPVLTKIGCGHSSV
jgi:hypothetical protein